MKHQHKIFARLIYDMRCKKPGAQAHPYECYQIAFPSCKSKRAAQVGASRLLKRDDIQKYLETRDNQLQAVDLNHKLVHAERVLDEEAKLGFHNVAQLYDENGQLMNIADMPEEIQRCIKTIEMGYDPATQTDYVKKITLYDKGKSLDRMQKILGMQREVKEIDIVGELKAMILTIDGRGKGVLPQEAG